LTPHPRRTIFSLVERAWREGTITDGRIRDLLITAREVLPGGALHGRALSDEVDTVFVRGRGSRIWDVEGKEYVDYLMGSGPMILGHAHPAVSAAIKERLDLGWQLHQVTEEALALARRITEAVPCAESVKFTGTGNEATHTALRLARACTGKPKILKFEGGFHGTHDYAAWSVRPVGPRAYPAGEPDSAGVPDALRDHVLVAPFNDTDRVCELIRRHATDLAAVIVEPLLRTIAPRPGFLEALRQTTAQCDVLLVFDEVVTGFRLAWGGGQQYYRVTPDLAALGKIIGGGFPVGAVVGPRAIMDRLDPSSPRGVHVASAGTYSGNPVTCAAGLATLSELESPGTYERLERAAHRLRAGFLDVGARLGRPVQVTGAGSIVGVLFSDREVLDYRGTLKADRELGRRLDVEMMKRGVWHSPGGKYYVSTAHTDEDLDETIAVFEAALRAAR
jgi:glutamate-1-semialdehyde 2,1-aminomutase